VNVPCLTKGFGFSTLLPPLRLGVIAVGNREGLFLAPGVMARLTVVLFVGLEEVLGLVGTLLGVLLA
jgi:hypothetical protein